MRIAPLAIAYQTNPKLAQKFARADAQITHVDYNVVYANDIFVTILVSLLQGNTNQVF